MQVKTKVALDVKTVSDLMNMDVNEVRLWPYLSEIRGIITDYNFGSNVSGIKSRLDDLISKCENDGIYDFAEGVKNAKMALIY